MTVDRGPFYNDKGYPDPTAYEALKSIDTEVYRDREEALHVLIHDLKQRINDAGFDLLNRIELRDRKTGKIFK